MKHYNIILPFKIQQTKYIVDCFSFFSLYGKEMLELRYHMMKDYVDYFVVGELNTTHVGDKHHFDLVHVLEELKIPQDKFIIVQLDTLSEKSPQFEDVDLLNSMHGNDKNIESIKARRRERLQKDVLLYVYKMFHDETVFIHSDLDEILNPLYINWFADMQRKTPTKIIKAPLVWLQGKANLRTYDKTTDKPAPWDKSLFLCLKTHLDQTTPLKIRSELQNLFPTCYVSLHNNIVLDVGWHFSWMGNKNTRKAKQHSFIHFVDTFPIDLISGGSYNNNEINAIIEQEPKEEAIPPSGDKTHVLKNYNINLLPKEIFDFKSIKEFLLPNVSIQEKIHSESLYTILENFEGWCSPFKASILIELIQKHNLKTLVEIGVFGGRSLIPQALALKHNKEGIIYGIDPWSKEAGKEYSLSDNEYWSNIDYNSLYKNLLNHIQKYDLEENVKLIRETSDNAIKSFMPETIDLLHIDGNHSEENYYRDVTNYFSLVKPSGFIIVDDITWNENGVHTAHTSLQFLRKHCHFIDIIDTNVSAPFAIFQKKKKISNLKGMPTANIIGILDDDMLPSNKDLDTIQILRDLNINFKYDLLPRGVPDHITFQIKNDKLQNGELWLNDKNSRDHYSAGIVYHFYKVIHDWYVNTDEEYALFCENDVNFELAKYWNFSFEEFIASLPTDWQYVQLTCTLETDQLSNIKFKLQKKMWHFWGNVVLLIKRSYAKIISESFQNNTILLQRTWYNKLIGTAETAIQLCVEGAYTIPLLTERDHTEGQALYNLDVQNNRKTIENFWKENGKNVTLAHILNI